MIDDIKRVVAVAVLDECIADWVGFPVVEKAQRGGLWDAQRVGEGAANGGKGQLDVVVAQQQGQGVSSAHQRRQSCKDLLIALDDAL